jgi:dimethylglycine dehydrogenase
MNALRLEKGYRAWGADLTSERTPFEAGLDPFVKTEGRQFVGRDALIARAGAPDCWSMALLALDDGAPDPFTGHTVVQDGRPVGMVTSGAYGHRTGRPLALAYLTDAADPATGGLSVLILGEAVAAEALDRPPYDPNNRRPRDTD